MPSCRFWGCIHSSVWLIRNNIVFSSLSRFRVDGRRLFKYASCKVGIFCKNRAKNLRFQKYSGTCEWGLRSYEHLRKSLFPIKWIIICVLYISASVLRKLSTGTEKRRIRTLLFRKYWRDVRWVKSSFAWYCCEISHGSRILAPVQQPGWTGTAMARSVMAFSTAVVP